MQAKFTVALLGVLLLLGGCSKTQPQAGNAPGFVNTTYICEDFSAALVIHPRLILDSKLVQSFPEQQRLETLKKLEREYPLNPQEIDEFILLMAGPTRFEDLGGATKSAKPVEVSGTTEGSIVRFRAPIDRRQILKRVDEEDAQLVEFGGKQFFRTGNVLTSGFWFPDDRTMVIAPERLLKKMMAAEKGTGPLADLLGKVRADHDVVGASVMSTWLKQAVQNSFAQEGEWGEQLGLAAVPEKMKQGLLTIDVDRTPLLTLTLDGNDQDAAVSLNSSVFVARDRLRALFVAWRPGLESKLPAELTAPILKLGSELLAGINIKQTGNQVGVTVNMPPGWENLAHTLEPIIAMSQVPASQELKRPLPQVKKSPAGSATAPR